LCRYTAKAPSIAGKTSILFKITVPCITTYPIRQPGRVQSFFGQLSVFNIEVESKKDIFPEDIVDIVDRHALMPIYSFLTEEDQKFVIEKYTPRISPALLPLTRSSPIWPTTAMWIGTR